MNTINEKEYIVSVAGKDIIIKPDNLAEQANGSVFIRCGDTIVLSTATMSKQGRGETNFFPLTVDYEEKFYAAGKILGSRYNKREGRPSDEAIITSRLIDRALRPLFPKELIGMEAQIISTCLSWDAENDSDILALISSSTALIISDIPFAGPVGAIRVGRIDGKFIANPTYKERKNSDINVIFAGLKDEKGEIIINMIEGEFKELNENDAVNAFEFAKEHIKNICHIQKEIAKKFGKEKMIVVSSPVDNEFEREIKELLGDRLASAIKDKSQRSKRKDKIEEEIGKIIKERYPGDEKKMRYFFSFLEEETGKIIQESILLRDERPDGRGLEDIRQISAEVAILPRTHGSALFSREQTKSLSILTLGSPGDQQLLERMEATTKKRFLHHYNFPPYSVGEVKSMRGPSRRDIGHGMLVEKAILPVLPDFENFPYTIRIVSEILSSSGSTSMASVCSASLALMDAGVPIKKHVAGISIGIIKSDDSDEYSLLVDIQGIEDYHGGMDFKTAGTREGLTAIQMDVKIKGIDIKIFSEALGQAKKARLKILEEMTKVLALPRENLSKYAPRVISFQINPEKIRDVIGSGGKIINEIINQTGVTIDINDSGTVFVTSEKEESALKAVQWIKDIVREVEIGEIFQGKVKKVLDFGAFVEILPGQEGLVHISKLADHRVEKVTDIVQLGDIISVKIIGIDDQGRINLALEKRDNK